MEGIFMSDSRDPQQTVTYLAERGAVIDNPLGVFMVMNNGTIQKTSKKDKSNSIIEFTSYAYDLSSFATQSAAPPFKPQERSTPYLIHPNPADRFYQQFPGKFRAELHYRLTAPLNAILFAILPLVFIGQAETTRQQRSATIGMGVGSSIAFGAAQFVLTSAAEDHFLAVVGLYALPLALIGIGLTLVLAGKQPRPPESLIAFGESLAHRMRTLFRSAAAAPARSA
jgi:lipopolysaccharide export system permease protein